MCQETFTTLFRHRRWRIARMDRIFGHDSSFTGHLVVGPDVFQPGEVWRFFSPPSPGLEEMAGVDGTQTSRVSTSQGGSALKPKWAWETLICNDWKWQNTECNHETSNHILQSNVVSVARCCKYFWLYSAWSCQNYMHNWQTLIKHCKQTHSAKSIKKQLGMSFEG